MDDLIKRQDAIDAIVAWTVEDRPDVEMPTDLVDRVNALPSAQQWIPCSERLPFAEYGESESVICCLEDGTQEILYFNGGNWCYPTGESYPFQDYKTSAVAWMPLPEPWKGE